MSLPTYLIRVMINISVPMVTSFSLSTKKQAGSKIFLACMFENPFLHGSTKYWIIRGMWGRWGSLILHCHTLVEFSLASCTWPTKSKNHWMLSKSIFGTIIQCEYLAGLKFSFKESDSKFPDIDGVVCFLKAKENECKSSLSLWIDSSWLQCWGRSTGLELSSVGCGAKAKYINQLIKM